jgi:catechol 2,3-dioxygenase-like lactoylglutathione lyase family enzyme
MNLENWSLRMVAPLEPGIVCANIEKMLGFYVGVLGLEMVSDAEATPLMSAEFGAAPSGYRIVRLQTPYGERVKLVQTRGLPRISDEPSRWTFERCGLAYLTFIVADVYEVASRLRANAVKFINQEPMEVRKGFRALFVTDPENNYVEFVQYADLASYRPDLAGKNDHTTLAKEVK